MGGKDESGEKKRKRRENNSMRGWKKARRQGANSGKLHKLNFLIQRDFKESITII